MEIRNLTPHAIHVLGEDNQVVLTLPALLRGSPRRFWGG